MTQLEYKTRGMSTPQDKERIYFSCHPADFLLYAESVFSDILEIQNCAIWYNPGSQGFLSEEDMDLNLGQMKLFVIPVTARFLHENNQARDKEFFYAIEHHIPVLPLMQEPGLEREFNYICGDMQCLSRNVGEDGGEIESYQKKLRQYLKTVLLGDRLAGKVREAFAAYIFLSYRKQDRNLARKLIRRIHEREFCRDIAVWYDEFLMPGEDFDDGILTALHNSSIFVMTVTPNLLEKDNYVMRVEYPEAKKQGKYVLPVEMEHTEEKVLQKDYEDIPGLISIEDEKELTEALTQALESIHIPVTVQKNRTQTERKCGQKEDPRHLFYIGLAYLGGIDVEVDQKRALELIRSAAEAGDEPAVRKMVDMYRTGDGVERNYREAIYWQEILAEILAEKYEQQKKEKYRRKYLNALWHLGDYLFQIRDMKRAEKVYRKMLDCAKAALEKDPSFQNRRNLLASCNNIGNLFRMTGRMKEAEEAYLCSLELAKELVRENRTPESRRDLSVAYDKIGNVCQAGDKLNEAASAFEEGLRITQSLAEEAYTVKNRWDLSVSYNKLGNIYRLEGRLEEAEAVYKKSLALISSLVEETRSAAVRRDLSVACEKLGNIFRSKNNLSQAQQQYEKSLKLRIELVCETGTVENRRDLLVAYGKLGNICMARGRLKEAEEAYRSSLGVARALAGETGAMESRRDLATCYEQVGEVLRKLDRKEESEKAFAMSRRILKRIYPPSQEEGHL